MKDKKQIQENTHHKPQRENTYIRRLLFETGRPLNGPEPLAEMPYDAEILSKDRSFSAYWHETGGGCPSSRVVGSPMPRFYRTTTKRRIHRKGDKIILCSDESSLKETDSLLEPETHSSIYRELSSLLNETKNRKIASSLNFIILRGNYESVSVIFNVKLVNGETVKGFTAISEIINKSFKSLEGAFIYHDPEGSRYYLNTASDIDGPRIKRLFGKRNLSVKVNDIIYTYSPEGFSQVNLSICGEMLNTARSLLDHKEGGRLVDLYCGYGFFSCFLAPGYDEIRGIDYGEGAVDSARENMQRVKPRAKWEFLARRIDKKTMPALLPNNRVPEYIILDPPRNGTAQGVVEILAARRPELVLHIFCGIETIPYELEKWNKGGYRPVQCVPLDMFPGTPDLEVMVLLKKKIS